MPTTQGFNPGRHTLFLLFGFGIGGVLKKNETMIFHVGSVYRRGVFMKPASCFNLTRENDQIANFPIIKEHGRK